MDEVDPVEVETIRQEGAIACLEELLQWSDDHLTEINRDTVRNYLASTKEEQMKKEAQMAKRRNHNKTVTEPSTRFTKVVNKAPDQPLGIYLSWEAGKWRVKFNNDVIGHIKLVNRNPDVVTPGVPGWCYRCWQQSGSWLGDLNITVSLLLVEPDPLFRAVEFLLDAHKGSLKMIEE